MPIGPLLSREPNDGLWTNKRIIYLFGLSWPELLVIGIGYKQGALNLLDDVPHVVLPYHLELLIEAFRHVWLHSPFDFLSHLLTGVPEILIHSFVEFLFFPVIEKITHFLPKFAQKRHGDIHYSWVCNTSRDPVFECQGAKDPVPSLAYSRKGNPTRVNVFALEQEVNHRCNNFFPVVAERDIL